MLFAPAKVMFVDYGNIERVSLDFLGELTMAERKLSMQVGLFW